jgi:hypothetical protein
MFMLAVSLVGIHIVFLWAYENHTDLFVNLTKEDGIFEYATAVFYVVAATIFVVKSFDCRRRLSKTWMWLIAAGFIFIAGEEISWGQRIFDYSVESVESVSTQEEFNVHNLKWLVEFRPARIQSIISLLFGVVLPVFLIARPLHLFITRTFAFPLPHPVLAFCFAASYVWYYFYHPGSPYPVSVEESRETTIALGFLIYAIMAGEDPNPDYLPQEV